MFFKQRLVMTKYDQIDKIHKICKNSKQSIIEIFTYLLNFIQNAKEEFKTDFKPDLTNRFREKMDQEQLSQLIICETNSYNQVLD